MLPKNTLGRKMLSKLKVYAGPDHPHQAQHARALRDHADRAAAQPGRRQVAPR